MRTAFSLIEMSVVLLIISIVAAGGISVGQNLLLRSDYEETDEQLETIENALLLFYQRNDRLPCPARGNLPIDNSQYGHEIIWDGSGASCANDTTTPSGTTRIQTASSSGIWVRSGALPIRALGLLDSMIADSFDGRFTYVVMEGLTDNDGFAAAPAALIINDGTGHDINNQVAFAIISHGNDGKGAYRYRSGVQITCDTGVRDTENCDGDVTYTDTFFNDGQSASDFFDDRIRWISKQRLIDRVEGLGRKGTPLQWAGITSNTYNGNLNGYVGADAICNTDYPGSRMLRENDSIFMLTQDNEKIVNDINASPSTNSANAAWIGGYIIGSFFPTSNRWMLPQSTNCTGYTSASGDGSVIGRNTSGNNPTIWRASCNTSRPIACVYE